MCLIHDRVNFFYPGKGTPLLPPTSTGPHFGGLCRHNSQPTSGAELGGSSTHNITQQFSIWPAAGLGWAGLIWDVVSVVGWNTEYWLLSLVSGAELRVKDAPNISLSQNTTSS